MTAQRENLKVYEDICELLPISKLTDNPGNTGYSDIYEFLKR